jgi:hypothetical protein
MRRNPRRTAEAAPVSPRQFVTIWQESSSLAEVAAKVRRKKNACRVRAFRYRKLGVPLKVFPPVEFPETDWEELARYAAELVAGEVDPEPYGEGKGRDRDARSETLG